MIRLCTRQLSDFTPQAERKNSCYMCCTVASCQNNHKACKVSKTSSTDFLSYIDKLYVINLASRPDRRREMEKELAGVGLKDNAVVTFFPAIKPTSAENFPSIGARGCFMSHLSVLREAQDKEMGTILILEDDATFGSTFQQNLKEILSDLHKTDWDIAYLGHRIRDDFTQDTTSRVSQHWHMIPTDLEVQTTHAMLIDASALASLIAYFERLLTRPNGHPDGGPMHVDGAYSWFRRTNPEFRTLATTEPYVLQRASQSDIAPSSWKDRIPFANVIRQIKNKFFNRF